MIEGEFEVHVGIRRNLHLEEGALWRSRLGREKTDQTLPEVVGSSTKGDLRKWRPGYRGGRLVRCCRTIVAKEATLQSEVEGMALGASLRGSEMTSVS
jgi:hypothetical protein